MEVTIKVEKTVQLKTLEVFANVRYWEDSTIDGITAETWYNAYDQLTGQTTYTGGDYVSDVWAWAAGQARGQDALRRARVRGLF